MGKTQLAGLEPRGGFVEEDHVRLDLQGQGQRFRLAQVQGQSLVPYLTGRAESAKARRYAFSERVDSNREHSRDIAPKTHGSFMIRGQGWKYWRHPDGAEYMYDLTADPGETANLVSDKKYQKQKETLRGELEAWLKRTGWRGQPWDKN